MFAGIEHFAIASDDTKRLAGWYAATLNFEIVFEHAGAYFVEAKNGALIEIIPALGARPPSEIRTPGLRHIAIAVDHFGDAYAYLQKQGVTFLGEPYEAQGNQLVFFSDLDGNVLHLIKRAQPLKPAATMNIAEQDL